MNIKNGKPVRSFFNGNSYIQGVLSFISQRNQNFPQFQKTEDAIDVNIWKPNKMFTANTTTIQFNTLASITPYIIIDLYQYSIRPTSYAISFEKEYTPPTEWTLTGSNSGKTENENEWTQFAYYSHSTNVCPYPNEKCGESVYYHFQCDQTAQYFRFIKLTYLKTRVIDFNPTYEKQYFRLMRLELFGYLTDNHICPSKESHIFISKSIFIYTYILVFK